MENIKDRATMILIEKLEESRRRNARASQRSFAKRVGLSSGALSEILNGKRLMSLEMKKKLAARLQLSPKEQLVFFEAELPSIVKNKPLEYIQLSADQFHLISDWWHYGILNLIKVKNFKPFPSWISKRLGISQKIATDAWNRLFRLGHLKYAEDRQVIRVYPRTETSDDTMNMSIQKAHLEDLKLIERSLLDLPVEVRDHTSITLVLNRTDIAKAKELIRTFQDHFSNQVEKERGEEVYRLSISLFPLTKVTEKT